MCGVISVSIPGSVLIDTRFNNLGRGEPLIESFVGPHLQATQSAEPYKRSSLRGFVMGT